MIIALPFNEQSGSALTNWADGSSPRAEIMGPSNAMWADPMGFTYNYTSTYPRITQGRAWRDDWMQGACSIAVRYKSVETWNGHVVKGGNWGAWGIRVADSCLQFYFPGNTARLAKTGAVTGMFDGKPHTAAMTCNGSLAYAGIRHYFDGVLIPNNAGASTDGVSLWAGGANNVVNLGYDAKGQVEYIYAWDRELSHGELLEILGNPYQIFRRRSLVSLYAPASSLFYRSLLASPSGAATYSRLVGLNRPVSVTPAAGYVRQIGKVAPATASTAATASKGVRLSRLVASTCGAALTNARAYVRSMVSSVTSTAAVQRGIAMSRAASVTATATAQRGIRLARLVSSAASGMLGRGISLARAATSAGTGALSRGVLLSRAASSVATGALSRGVSLLRSVASTAVGSVVRQIRMARAAAVTVGAVLTSPSLLVYFRSLLASSSAAGVLNRSVSKVVAATSSGAAALSRGISMARLATSSVLSALAKVWSGSTVYTRALAVSVTSVASSVVSRTWNRALLAAASVAGAVQRQVWLSRVAVEPTLGAYTRSMRLGLLAPVVLVLSSSKAIRMARVAVAAGVGGVFRGFGVRLVASIGSALVLGIRRVFGAVVGKRTLQGPAAQQELHGPARRSLVGPGPEDC